MTKFERILNNSFPVVLVRKKSKRIIIPGFEGLCLYDVFIFFVRQIKKEGLNVRAAAISFNVLAAIPAATLFICTLIPFFPVSHQFFNELVKVVSDLTPNKATQKLMVSFLDDFFNKEKTGLLSIGLAITLFYSSNAMMQIIRSFDRSVVDKFKSNFINKRLRALKLTLIMVLLMIGTVLILMGQGVLFIYIMKSAHITSKGARTIIADLRWLIIVLLFFYSIAFIYKYAPSVRDRWKLHSAGAFFATFLIVLATWLFSKWTQNFSNYNKFYGSIGTILILMLLVFINSLIVLIGFELNISITYLKKEKNRIKH